MCGITTSRNKQTKLKKPKNHHQSIWLSYGCWVQTLTFAARDHRNVAGARAAVENDGFLYPGDEEVGTFPHHHVLDPSEPVKDDGSVSRVN